MGLPVLFHVRELRVKIIRKFSIVIAKNKIR